MVALIIHVVLGGAMNGYTNLTNGISYWNCVNIKSLKYPAA
jgi:hypothetical protein